MTIIQPLPISPNPASDFERDVLQRMSDSLGITWEQMTADHPPRLVATERMVRLGASHNRRQRKRGWRMYFAANGKQASHGFFYGKINEYSVERMRKMWMGNLAEKFFAEQEIEFPVDDNPARRGRLTPFVMPPLTQGQLYVRTYPMAKPS